MYLNFTQFQNTMTNQRRSMLGIEPTAHDQTLWDVAYTCGYNQAISNQSSTRSVAQLAGTRGRGRPAGTGTRQVTEPSPASLAGKVLAQIRAVPGITNQQLASSLNQKVRAFTTIFGKQRNSLVTRGFVTGSATTGWHATTGAATPMAQQRAA